MDLMDSILSESDSETDLDKILSINPPQEWDG
jgi:hypothetical protein